MRDDEPKEPEIDYDLEYLYERKFFEAIQIQSSNNYCGTYINYHDACLVICIASIVFALVGVFIGLILGIFI